MSKVRATPSDQISSVQRDDKISSDQEPKQIKKFNKAVMNEPTRHTKKRSQTVEAKGIMSARQMQKLIKNDEPVFLAAVRTSDNFVPRGKWNKLSPGSAVVQTAHGMTKSQRRKINKESRPKKNLKSVKEREQEVLDGVSKIHRAPLEKMIQKY